MVDEASVPVFEFDVPETRPASTPRVQLKFGNDTVTMLEPKLSIAVQLVNLAEGGDTVIRKGLGVVQVLNQVLAYVLEEPPDAKTGKLRGRARLYQRMSDPLDSFDLFSLAEPFKVASKHFFENRPTGPSRGSSARRAKTSSSSARATRSTTAARTSGTPRKRSS